MMGPSSADVAPESMGADRGALLSLEDVRVYFPIRRGVLSRHVGDIKAVDGVSFFVREGETLGLVGESGCGKSTTARAITQLVRPTSGSVYFKGEDLTKLDGEELRKRRRDIQMVFQDPYASLNRRMTVGSIIEEPLNTHGVGTPAERKERVEELLVTVGLDPAFMVRYPHAFSGGQRQRVGIARALALQPDMLVCDEPISSLDVSIQAQVVNLLVELQDQFGLTYLFIAHDLAMVRHISDRVAVMYLGKIVELADSVELYDRPLHPYTRALLSAIPEADPEVEARRRRIPLVGEVPSAANPPSGCHFRTRCSYAEDVCASEEPPLQEVIPEHWVACHFVEDSIPPWDWKKASAPEVAVDGGDNLINPDVPPPPPQLDITAT